MITLIFLSSYEEANLIPSLKEALILYFGTRNIEERYDEFPILGVKELTADDRTAICSRKFKGAVSSSNNIWKETE